MSALASQWLLDTFIYTGLLIGLVLLLRRPVSRYFGPTMAYALWALPLLRFIMPPLVLPANMAPVAEAAPVTGEPLMVIISDPQAASAGASAVAAATNAPEVGIALIDVLIPVWLLGALGFLTWRALEYRKMRRELLAEARPMGESGTVRLVETPAVTSPVAFGIGDKVVALPPGFMALYNREARDMAIAHELAHHRGFDLLANILAQPVLALHWFNPLAWWGWRAMRKDQEAACDARVVAGRGKSERAAYAKVIAGFAANGGSLDDLALAAPMACPVLGEKSIIHRLRSLSMSEVPTGRRRLGIAVLATSALVLPATASITYAQADAPELPAAPAAPLAPAAPQAPEAPEPPAAPEAPSIQSIDPDSQVVIHVDTDDEDGSEVRTHVVHHNFVHSGDAPLSREERERMRTEVMRELENARAEIDRAMAEAERAHAEARRHTVVVDSMQFADLDADCDGEQTVIHKQLDNGAQAMIICQQAIGKHALNGMRLALEAIRDNESIPAEERHEAVESLEEAIEEMEERGISLRSQARSRAMAPRVQASAFNTGAQRVNISARYRAWPGNASAWQVETRVSGDIQRGAECDEEKVTRQPAGVTV